MSTDTGPEHLKQSKNHQERLGNRKAPLHAGHSAKDMPHTISCEAAEMREDICALLHFHESVYVCGTLRYTVNNNNEETAWGDRKM